MVSSFSNPSFPHVHAHPTRLPAMDASLSAAIDSFEASMRSMRAAFREAIDSALAPIRREIALLRRDLVLGVEGDSDPASMCSKEAESIEAGHQKLQKLETHDGDGNPLRIPSTIQDHSIPPLLLSSPMLRAFASYPVKPQLKESVAATIPLQHFEKPMPVATVTTVPFPFSAIVGKTAALSQLADQDANVTTHIEGCEDHKSFKMQILRLCKPTSTHTNTTKRRHEVLTSLLSTFTYRKDKWYWILQFILAYYTGVIAIMYEDFLIDKCGWVNWYLVGKFVKKDFYALKLFEKMSEKGSEDKMEIAHWRDFYNSENTSCIWNSCSCTTVVELLVSQFQGISATFYHYATSGPQVGDELFQFKNAEFDHIKGIENLGVRWIALPTASILILLLDGMSKRHNYNWNFHSCSYAVWNAPMLCGMHKLMHHLVLQIHDHDWHLIGDTQSIKVEVKVSVGICHGGYTTLWWLLWRMKAIGITSFAKAPMEFLSPIELQLRMVCIFFYSWAALFVTDQAIHDRIKGIITSMNAQIPYFKKIFSMITNHLTSFLNLKIEVNLPLKKDGTTTASILILLLDGMHFKKYLEFLQNLEEIIEALDGIKVARVDLGVEIPLEQIPTVPEEITNVYRQLNKLVTVAYQFLELVIEYPTPTLAKVADVSAAVRQYAFNIVRSISIVESLIDAFSQQWFSVKLIYAFCCLLILILGIVGMHYVVNLVGGSKEPIKSMAAIESIALVLAYFTNKRIITSLLYYGGRIGYGKENRERLLGKWEVVDVNDCCSCALYLVDSGKIYGKHLYNTKNFHVEGSSTVSSRKPVIFADETCATQTAALGNANFAPVFVQGSLAYVRNWYQLWAVVHTANAVLESITDTQTELQLMELGECAFYGTNSNQPIQIMKVMVLRLTSLSILWDSGDTRFCQIQSAATVTTPMDHCRNKTSSSFFNLEDIKLRPISKVIILGNGPIAIVAALVENLLAGSLGVGPFSPFDAASCFLATSMEIEMISWVEIYEEATGDKSSLTKLWGAAITSSGVLSGSSPKVESYLQIVFAVPAASLLLQDSLVSARSNKFFKFQP